MTIGFDVSKDSQNKNTSFGCLVATMDLKSDFSFFATVSTYSNSETLSNEFSMSVKKAIIAYRDKYNALPRKVIIYRGGVGDGDIGYVKVHRCIHFSNVMRSNLDAQFKLFHQCELYCIC